MMKFGKVLALGAVLVASATIASAAPITGTATVFGFDTFTPTSITFTPNTGVIVGSGTLMSGNVILDSFSFAGANNVTLFNMPSIESFVISGPATVVSVIDGTFLNISGVGTFFETGYSPTPGTFTLTSTKNGATSFTIDSMPTAVTPEPSSLILLGTGLVSSAGMLLRRRRTV